MGGDTDGIAVVIVVCCGDAAALVPFVVLDVVNFLPLGLLFVLEVGAVVAFVPKVAAPIVAFLAGGVDSMLDFALVRGFGGRERGTVGTAPLWVLRRHLFGG